MKILIVTNSLSQSNGASKYSAGLVEALVTKGHQIECLVETASEHIEIPQYAVLKWSSQYLVNPFRLYALAQEIQKRARVFQPDLIHFLVEPYALSAAFLPRKFPPLCMTIHGTYAYIPHHLPNALKRTISEWLTQKMYKRVESVISVSEYTKQFLLGVIDKNVKPLLSMKVTVIGNGIQESLLQPLALQAAHTPRRFLFVGGVKERKGVLEALAAVAEYRTHSGEQVIFHVAGSLNDEPWYVERVRARIAELQLEKSAVLLGAISDEQLQSEYTEADVFIMLSLGGGKEFEGFGLVYLEANAHSVPVLGAYGTGAEEAIKNGISGYLVHANDPGEAATVLEKILGNKPTFARGAHEWAEEHLWGAIVSHYENVYASLTSV